MILFSHSLVIDGFVGPSSLGWNVYFLKGYRNSFQALLIFRVTTEKLEVILIGLHLHVTWFYPGIF